MKRMLGGSEGLQAKRSKLAADELRLCDLRSALAVFSNQTNANRARERGYLRSRDGSEKYEECERKLLALFKDCAGLDVPDGEWLLTVLPELKVLEADTLETMLAQVEQHNRYERAARELVAKARESLEDEHRREMNEVRLQLESEAVRKTVGVEMKLKALDEQAREEQEELKEEAETKISQLEETIAELEAKLEAASEKIEATEEAAKDEVQQMHERCDAMLGALDEAQQETELKREANMKLKDEIIGNDHLTVANLNRIKHLEAENDKMRGHLEMLEQENDDLKDEVLKHREEKENGASDEDIKELKATLSEREAQLISISHRLAEATSGSGNILSPVNARRDSLMERLGLANSLTNTSKASLRIGEAI
jgi:chromosome segregation ATPase